MTSILGLFIHGRIPISIIKYNITRSSKIQSNSSWPRTTDKAKHSRIVVKSLHNGLSELSFSVAI